MQNATANHTKTVLIAPLDWGLGHTTRCIPIIKALLVLHYNVIVAANGIRREIILQEFSQVKCIAIPDYAIEYGKTKWLTIWKLFGQLKKIKKAIAAEQQWLLQIVQEYNIDCIISDNRYGLYHTTVPSIFITHQLQPKSLFYGLGEKYVQNYLYEYINKFAACWVVDEQGDNNLAGELSHPKKMPNIPVSYMGVLTRLQYEEKPIIYKTAVLLSGPEPQRTILENKLLEQLKTSSEKIVVIRGVSENKTIPTVNNNVTLYNLLPVATLNTLLNQTTYIICRSGYTSVMDLLLLQKKCIFIPTPAQTEQEYLAKYLEQKQYAISYTQQEFTITEALAKAENFNYLAFVPTEQNLPKFIQDNLQKLCNQEPKHI